MKKRLLSLFATVLFVSVLLSSCSKDEEKKIVGIYVAKKTEYIIKQDSKVMDSGTETFENEELTLEFKSDNSYVVKENGKVDDEGSFRIEEGSLFLTSQGEDDEEKIEIIENKDNKLTLRMNSTETYQGSEYEYDFTLYFEKK